MIIIRTTLWPMTSNTPSVKAHSPTGNWIKPSSSSLQELHLLKRPMCGTNWVPTSWTPLLDIKIFKDGSNYWCLRFLAWTITSTQLRKDGTSGWDSSRTLTLSPTLLPPTQQTVKLSSPTPTPKAWYLRTNLTNRKYLNTSICCTSEKVFY